MVGLGGPSGLEHKPPQDLLCVSFSGFGRELNSRRDAYDLMGLSGPDTEQ